MSERESATFRDKFALHLALELLGPDNVIEYLDGNNECVPLYWRSKLMVSDPSRIMFHFGEKTDSKSTLMMKSTDVHIPKVLFFDVTFNFAKIQQQQQQEQEENSNNCDDPSSTPQQSSTSSASVTLGFFLLLPDARREFPSSGENKGHDMGGGHYISTRPLDHSQLMSHVDSLQLDPQSVTAKALARSMAGEFLRQGPPSTNNEMEETDRTKYLRARYVSSSTVHKSIRDEENEDQKSTNVTFTESQSVNFPPNDVDLRVDVPYKSIGNANGIFLLKSSADGGVTKYSISSLRFLYWDFSKNANHCHPLRKNDESIIIHTQQLVEEAFDRWRTQIVPVTDSSDRKHAVDESNNSARKPQVEHSAGNVLPPTKVNSSVTINNSKKRKLFRGASILPSARRKRNRGLVYDQK